MPTQNFSLGKDCSLVVIAPNGQRFDLSLITEFDIKQDVHKVRVPPLNGPPQEAHIPNGWTGTIKIDRGNSAADDLFTQIEAGFWAGGILGTGTIYQFVTEKDKSQSTYQHNGVTMSLSGAGTWKADSAVPQTVEFFASTRTRL